MKMLRRFALSVLAFAAATQLALADSKPLAPGAPVVFKLSRSRESDLRASKTIVIPTLYLQLSIAGKVSAVKQGGSNSVKAKAYWATGNLDKEFTQTLAQKIYDDLVAKLRAVGYTVKTYDDIKDLEAMKKAERVKIDATWGGPVGKSDALLGTSVVTVAPSEQQHFKKAMAWGLFNQFISRTKSVLGEGTILIPTITIAAPQAWAETERGYKSITASAHVAHGMNLTHARADFMTEKGSGGAIMTSEQIINIGEKVGELSAKDTTDRVGNAISFALGTLTGTGKMDSSSGYYHLTVDRAAYEVAVLRGALAFNSIIAEAAAKK